MRPDGDAGGGDEAHGGRSGERVVAVGQQGSGAARFPDRAWWACFRGIAIRSVRLRHGVGDATFPRTPVDRRPKHYDKIRSEPVKPAGVDTGDNRR